MNSKFKVRAISYSLTIENLFTQIINNKYPADNTIATYFRANKKHGSKDRKIIKDSLFAIFRWWGWLQQFSYPKENSWNNILYAASILENHPWEDIVEQWASLANITHNNSYLDPQKKLKNIYPDLDLSLDKLIPSWCNDFTILDKERLLKSLCSRPPIWARAQNISPKDLVKSLKEDEIKALAHPKLKSAVNLGYKNINLDSINAYTSGNMEMQDIASQVVALICEPKDHETWWDACCGAGGKTLHLLSQAKEQNIKIKITASDIRENIFQELQRRVNKAKFKSVKTKLWENDILPVDELFDGVLVDAPCSCSGVWRRNPEARWLIGAEEVLKYAKQQLSILIKASDAVKLNGTLIYATCSIFKEENQDVLDAFLKKNPNFKLIPIQNPLTDEVHDTLTILPDIADSDNMFIAKMVKFK